MKASNTGGQTAALVKVTTGGTYSNHQGLNG